MNRILQNSLEDMKTTKENESELTIFGTIENISQLHKLRAPISHYDYMVKAKDAKIRLRVSTQVDKLEKNELCIKKKENNDGIYINNSVETTLDVSSLFKESFISIATFGVHKDRYTIDTKEVSITIKDNGESKEITLPPSKWEIDIYYDSKGELTNIVKVDLELQEIFKYLEDNDISKDKISIDVSLKSLPIDLKDPFVVNDTMTNSNKETLDNWFSGLDITNPSEKKDE